MTNQTTNTTNINADFSKTMVSFQKRKDSADKAQAKFFHDNFETAILFQEYIQLTNKNCFKKDDKGNLKLSKNGKPLVDNKKLSEMLTETPFGNATWILERAFRNEKSVILNTTSEQTRENMANNPDSNATAWHGLEQAEKKRIAKIAREMKKDDTKDTPKIEAINNDDDDIENAPLAIRQTIGKITADKDYQNLNSSQVYSHMTNILKALLKDNGISNTSYKTYLKELKTGTNN